jgi:hypothetical protein
MGTSEKRAHAAAVAIAQPMNRFLILMTPPDKPPAKTPLHASGKVDNVGDTLINVKQGVASAAH